MIAPARQRIMQRTAGVLTFTPVDSDGEPSTVDPGTVTVGVVNSAGDVVVAAGTATTAAGATRTVPLTAVHTAELDVLTATWTASAVTIGVTTHDVVGGVYFQVAALRLDEPTLRDESKYPREFLVDVRNEVEAFFESETNYAWVPRFSVVDVSPGGLTDLFAIRSVRWVRNYSDAATFTLFTAAELAAISASGFPYGTLYNGSSWYGTRFVAGVEHGADAPPTQLKAQAIRYARMVANRPRSGIPSRTVAMQVVEGGTLTFRKADPTGDEEIDKVLRSPAIDHRLVGIG